MCVRPSLYPIFFVSCHAAVAAVRTDAGRMFSNKLISGVGYGMSQCNYRLSKNKLWC